MTGLGEEVCTAPGDADHIGGVNEMVQQAGMVAYITDDQARTALESLWIPLEVLAELKAGKRVAMSSEEFSEAAAEVVARFISMSSESANV